MGRNLTVGALCLAAALSLSCTEPEPRNSLIFASSADATTLDPHNTTDGDVLRSLSKKKMYGSPNSNPSPELGADKENHTSWERYYQVSDCSSSLRNDWYSGI